MEEVKWSRENKISFIVLAIYDIEGVHVFPHMFEGYTDEQLDEQVDWYDYLYGK